MIKIFPNVEKSNNFAAEKFVEIANDSIEKRKSFTVALAGGSTPKSLYQLLSGVKFRDKIDWAKVFFFFGDERHVLPADAESNFRMARENLFEPLQISDAKIIRWKTEENDVGKTVENYQDALQLNFALAAGQENPTTVLSGSDEGKWLPRFDLILLGMGADGHTASLFPFTEALHETEKTAVANYVKKLNDWRFTMTFPIINNARNIIFLVAGEEKAETLQAVLEGDFEPEKFPAQNVRPEHGSLFWLLDKNVAKLLKK